jgi:hypothetical protein
MRHLLVGGPLDGEYRYASEEVWQVFSDASGSEHQYRRTHFEIGDLFFESKPLPLGGGGISTHLSVGAARRVDSLCLN